ncbi:hypothetical protein [Geosporobacter ferrireducens]|uniref:Uncharacterized protein n=1 Tax=Geosporobacter ferrireducens TaxID=1424294 RepID=A0A1D8GP90_9FIRM|nr:hypothetical protein [Geosporobacter ferrireducens]AOT72698.1 hypothetical protein Gferi_25960 [Geosporobacter ferrireducens]MTI55107.1 hypothetical protein [Geosporobacter ferrireducens]
MKKALLVFLLLIAIFIHGKFIFADDNIVQDQYPVMNNESEMTLIEGLFKQRTELWNDLYEANKNHEQFKNRLSQIVAEPLLSFDTDAFESLISDPTDMDKVLKVEVIKIENLSYGKTNMRATVTILWKMQGLEGHYLEEIKYKVVLLKDKGVWKLSDYSITQ